MALLDLTKAAASIDMADPNLVSFGSFENGDATLWSYLTPGNNDVELKGSDLTYDAAGHAQTGTINSITIDLANDSPAAPDMAITGLSVAAATLDDGPDSFWRILEGDDAIVGPGPGATPSSALFKLFGDGISARTGSTSGGSDSIQPGEVQAEVVGDVMTVGSRAAGTPQANYRGGNDDIQSSATLKFQELVGDAKSVFATGRLTGGNDTILIHSMFGTAIGDAYDAEGLFGDQAVIIGGNDLIIAGESSLASLVGDVFVQRSNSFVDGGNDTINGSGHGEEIIGDVNLIGGNRLIGGADLISANGGDDFLLGDFSVSSPGSSVTGGNDTILGGDGDDSIFGEGRSGPASLSGGNDVLFGDAGFDTIHGQSGNDLLDGGINIDTLVGGAGNDTYVVERPADSIVEALGEGIDTVRSTGSLHILADNVENLTFIGTDFFFGKGNGLANAITSTGGNDLLEGLAGNDRLAAGGGVDTLQGGADNDTLEGGSGADVLDGGAGLDMASYAEAPLAVRVSLDGSLASTGDAMGDTFVAIEWLAGSGFNDVLRGDANSNVIFGNAGADVLQGQAGNDALAGGLNADFLVGGAGNDRFHFSAVAEGGDRIADFTNAAGNNDAFTFDGDAFGGLAAGRLAANRFVANASGAATTADQRFVYETDTGILRFDANGSATGGVTVIATLTGAPALSAADFLIV